MKALIPLLLVATSALAVTTVQFAQRASTERKRADDALAASRQHEARIRELEKAQGTLEQQLMEAQRPAMADVSTTAPNTGMARVLQPIRQRVDVPIATITAAPVAGQASYNIRPWSMTQQSPAAQRFWYWQRKAGLRRQYEDVGSALGLSQAQANKLVDVLADQQSRMMGGSFRQPLDMRKQTESEVAAVIGQDKLPQWQEYQKSLPERSRVNMVGEQLRQMDVPLTDDQRAQLVNLVMEQTQQNPRPSPQDGLPPEEMLKASIKWEEDADKALLERAKNVLTQDQYERYRDFQAWQSELRANSVRYVQSAVANGQASGVGLVSSQTFVAPAAPSEPAK